MAEARPVSYTHLAADKWMANMNDSEGSKEAAAELKPLIAACAEKGCPICKELKTLDHYLVKRCLLYTSDKGND